ncbi:MobC family plasmid mobilization relaxosome protein [Paracoccus jiaweipingae]|uniref:MobC family plasmid mobilization relaxosome protein n=1 Tax=unclassified Paracoccus (in: a-proteobacteria) TaxID=2688777 RepID=UPI0037B96A27
MPDDAVDNPIWIKLRASSAERARWQALAVARGVSLSELIRSRLDGTRLRSRREAPPVAPDLLRELARIGNNLNQLARAANRREPVTALLARLIEIDRELALLRAAHQRPDAPLADSGDGIG